MALALTMTREKTAVFFLSVYKSDGVTPQPLAGTVLWFHAKIKNAVIDKSSPSSGITITNAAGGLNCATLQIEPSETAAIPTFGAYLGYCELTLQNGSELYELDRGTITVEANVGTP